MFDIGFIELLLIGVIALLVIGPEQLPQVVIKAGRLMGQLKKTSHQWSSEINRQIDNEAMMAELKKQTSLDTLDDNIAQLHSIKNTLSGDSLGVATAANKEKVVSEKLRQNL